MKVNIREWRESGAPLKRKKRPTKCHLKAEKYAKKQTKMPQNVWIVMMGCFDCHMDHQSPKYAEMVP
jgi:hypothetical protein